jgi:iron(III) transport system permease protein
MSRAIVLALLFALLGWPALATVFSGGESGGASLLDAAAWADDLSASSGPALQTIRVVLATEAVSLSLGVPLALLIFKTDLLGRRTLAGILALTLFVPMPLYATGWIGGFGNAGRLQAFGDQPLITGWLGAAFIHAMSCIPWVVAIVGLGLLSVEPELEESALTDRPGWWVLIHISLRRSLGAIGAAALTVAILTAGDMTVTDLLRVRTYAEEAYVQFGLGRSAAEAARVAAPPMLILGVLILFGVRAISRLEPSRIATAHARPWRCRLAGWRLGASVAAWLTLAFMTGPPLYSLIWRAGRLGGLNHPATWSPSNLARTLASVSDEIGGPLVASTLTSAAAASIAVCLGWTIAWICRASPSRRFGVIVALSVAVTLATPGPVAGLAIKMAYLHVPPVHDTTVIVILGLVMRTWPFALLLAWPAVVGLPASFLESAAIDGYGPIGVMTRVALPLTLPAIAGAWGFSFVMALGELPVTNLVTPPGFDALSTFLWQRLHFGVDSELAGIGLILLVVYGAIGLLATLTIRRAFQNSRTES